MSNTDSETIRMIVEIVMLIAVTFFGVYWKKAKNYSKVVEVQVIRADEHIDRFVAAIASFNKANEDNKITDEEWEDSYGKFKDLYDGIVNEINRPQSKK